MTSLAAMQQLSAIEGTANTPPRKWKPIFDRAVGATRRVGKCVPMRGGQAWRGNPRLKVAIGSPGVDGFRSVLSSAGLEVPRQGARRKAVERPRLATTNADDRPVGGNVADTRR
jgi:hypothetical protein